MQLFQIGVMTKFLCHGSIAILVLVITLFLVFLEFLSRPRKFVMKDLISCYSFILMLRHGLLVLSMFAVATQFVMSRHDFSVFNLSLCCDLVCYVVARLLFLMLES